MLLFAVIIFCAILGGVGSYFFGPMSLLVTLPLCFVIGLWAGSASFRSRY